MALKAFAEFCFVFCCGGRGGVVFRTGRHACSASMTGHPHPRELKRQDVFFFLLKKRVERIPVLLFFFSVAVCLAGWCLM